MKYVNFAMKEETYSRYCISLPESMNDATEEEIKEYILNGNWENIEYIKHLDTVDSEVDFDYEFEVNEY